MTKLKKLRKNWCWNAAIATAITSFLKETINGKKISASLLS